MIELQLVGYTADLAYLVFCDAATGASRFKVPVDEDLLATLGELVERTDPALFASLFPPPPAPPPPPPAPPPPPPPAPVAPPARSGVQPGVGPLAAVVMLADIEPATSSGNGASPHRGSRLSPREIQALLRAGRTPAAVAREAGIDEDWVQRWLAPIEAERERIIRAVRAATLTKTRLGPSDRPLGEAVDQKLRGKGVSDDSEPEWSAARRDGDPYWIVAVRYRSRGRVRRARWRYDPEAREVTAADKASLELGWRRGDQPATGADEESPAQRKKSRRSAKRSTGGRGGKQAAAKRTKKKSTSAKKSASAKQSAPAKKSASAKQSGPAKKSASAKKTAPAKKSTPAKRATPGKKSAPPPEPQGGDAS